VKDETGNAELNGNRNPEWWGDFIQLQIQIKQKSQCEFVPRDTSEFKSNQNLNLTLYREIPRNLIFSILTSWLKSPHHLGFQLPLIQHFESHKSFRRAKLLYKFTTEFFVVRKRVKYWVLTLFRAKFVVGAPVRKPKYWKCWHHDGDTSRYLEIQFL